MLCAAPLESLWGEELLNYSWSSQNVASHLTHWQNLPLSPHEILDGLAAKRGKARLVLFSKVSGGKQWKGVIPVLEFCFIPCVLRWCISCLCCHWGMMDMICTKTFPWKPPQLGPRIVDGRKAQIKLILPPAIICSSGARIKECETHNSAKMHL